MIFSVFKVRYAPETGPSRDRLVNYRFAQQLVSLVEQNSAYESQRERLVALEAKVAELTALLAQSVTPVSEVQLASR